MNKLLIAILIVSIIGNLIGLLVVYKYFKARRSIEYVRQDLDRANRTAEDLTGVLDRLYSTRMVFLHHSVGRGILYQGGLRDSLLQIGVLTKGATYGDEIGQKTDISDWLPKFRNDMTRILDFKAHPNTYYSGALSNDIVMFKSCFPNSDIGGSIESPADPLSSERSLANYQATFNELALELEKYPDKLMIYLTSPPLVPESTTPENARRARDFNDWLIEEYLPQYQERTGLTNLAIFDLFGVLADENGFLKDEYRRTGRGDSHPNETANKAAAQEFMEFFRPLWTNWQQQSKTSVASSG